MKPLDPRLQQIALARAFLRDAPLLLLDEPAAHLDAASTARLDAVLNALTAGRTVIQVSHAPGHEDTSRVLTLDRGKLTQVLAPMPAPSAPALLAVS
jgi:ABC-type transport system involved in cytochrome bd biosynthesis fused ATPase/permease subunit